MIKYAKIGFVLGLGAIGAYTISSGFGHISSKNAVIASPVISLRSPIGGVVSGINKNIGETISKDELIANINDTHIDTSMVTSLKSQLQLKKDELRANHLHIDYLKNMSSSLNEDSNNYHDHSNKKISFLVEEAKQEVEQAEAKLSKVSDDVKRRLPLEEKGYVTKIAMHQYRTAEQEAIATLNSKKARLQSLKVEMNAAKNGILLSQTGASDKTYSQQRVDEINLMYSNLLRQTDNLKAEISSLETRINDELSRIEKFSNYNIKSPTYSYVWKTWASNGELRAAGDRIVDVVDCTNVVMLVSIHQDQYENIEIGGNVKYRLSGENIERSGKVISVIASKDIEKSNFAAVPIQLPETIIVAVSVDVKENTCLVGRNATVLLPTK